MKMLGDYNTKKLKAKISSVDNSTGHTDYSITVMAEDGIGFYPRDIAWDVSTRYSELEKVLEELSNK